MFRMASYQKPLNIIIVSCVHITRTYYTSELSITADRVDLTQSSRGVSAHSIYRHRDFGPFRFRIFAYTRAHYCCGANKLRERIFRRYIRLSTGVSWFLIQRARWGVDCERKARDSIDTTYSRERTYFILIIITKRGIFVYDNISVSVLFLYF